MGSCAKFNGGGGGGERSGGEDDVIQLAAELGKTLKEGERILAPTRRPDGTLRKPIRIRAGYVPQDEVAIYKSRGSLWRKEMESLQDVPPGYDPVTEAKPKTKAAKRNERKKEKRQQAALEKGKDAERNDISPSDDSNLQEHEEKIASQLNDLSISASSTPNSLEGSTPTDHAQDIDKKIRALKKKIRLAEAQLQKTGEQGMKPEQLERVAKLESWRQELKILEDKKAESVVS